MRKLTLKEQLRRERKIRTKILLLFSLLILAFFVHSFLFGNMGFLKYKELKKNEEKLIKEINQIQKTNDSIKDEINLLKKDPTYFEKYAREKFGLVRPGEMVFQFKDVEK